MNKHHSTSGQGWQKHREAHRSSASIHAVAMMTSRAVETESGIVFLYVPPAILARKATAVYQPPTPHQLMMSPAATSQQQKPARDSVRGINTGSTQSVVVFRMSPELHGCLQKIKVSPCLGVSSVLMTSDRLPLVLPCRHVWLHWDFKSELSSGPS